jgi:hypothetical protein
MRSSNILYLVAQHKIYKVRSGLLDMSTYALDFRVADVSDL